MSVSSFPGFAGSVIRLHQGPFTLLYINVRPPFGYINVRSPFGYVRVLPPDEYPPEK